MFNSISAVSTRVEDEAAEGVSDYQELVNQLIAAQEDPTVKSRLAQAFTHLTDKFLDDKLVGMVRCRTTSQASRLARESQR
ncbi:hypothetical protein FHG87_020161 [Trinorchestia longiramus]|nr:hypothetical protein FHG87_020161 [Trinorchestia longiramus]